MPLMKVLLIDMQQAWESIHTYVWEVDFVAMVTQRRLNILYLASERR